MGDGRGFSERHLLTRVTGGDQLVECSPDESRLNPGGDGRRLELARGDHCLLIADGIAGVAQLSDLERDGALPDERRVMRGKRGDGVLAGAAKRRLGQSQRFLECVSKRFASRKARLTLLGETAVD